MGARVTANTWLVVFCPFAAGYYLSFFYRNVNAVIARELTADFGIGPSDLGFLTSLYLLCFALVQLPVGVLLDRYGPRVVNAALLLVAAAGAMTFALAPGFTALALGRALIGFGVSAALMSSLKAFTLWFPLSRLATVNGLFLGIGGLGALSATAPAEAALGIVGWRGLFVVLSAAALAAAAAVLLVVPERKLPGAHESFGQLFAAFGTIYRSAAFLRIVLAFVVSHSAYLALQGLWLAPWLYDVAGLDRAAAANHLLITAAGYTVGSIFFGMMSDRLATLGISRLAVLKGGLALTLAMFALLAAGVTTALPAILALYGFSAISGGLAYALLTPLFGPGMAGRVNTASNVLMFMCSFAFQWGIGAVLKSYPAAGGGHAPEGYLVAFAVLAALQVAVLAWLLPMREIGGSPRGGRKSSTVVG